MQAIILAAGDSTRYEGNKLLTLFKDKLLVEYAIDFCIENNIEDIFITLSPYINIVDNPIYQIVTLNYGINNKIKLNFAKQNIKEYGPGAAIKVWEKNVSEDFIVLMGDNFIQGKLNFKSNKNDYLESISDESCIIGYLELPENIENLKFATIQPREIEVYEERNIWKLKEKPHSITKGKFFIGFAYFGVNCMNNIANLKPSKRGELEITDFINLQTHIELYDMTQLNWIDITFKYQTDDVYNYISKVTPKEPKIFNFYDWDQTLVLSDKLLYESYSNVLSKHDYNFSFEYFMKAIYPDSTSFLRATGIDDQKTINIIKEEKEDYYLKHLKDLKFTPLFTEILINKNRNVINAIVTNTKAILVDDVLIDLGLNDFNDNIKFIIGSDIIKQRKPYPNLYLEAFDRIAEDFDYEYDTLNIYEDSLDGLTAAVAFFNELKNGYNGFQEIKNFKIIHVSV